MELKFISKNNSAIPNIIIVGMLDKNNVRNKHRFSVFLFFMKSINPLNKSTMDDL